MQLCLLDLVHLTGGRLCLSPMPPREGELAAIGRICLTALDVQPGDVCWCLPGQPCDAELAFLRGALGVVSECGGEPWPGRFRLVVDDAAAALERLVSGVLRLPTLETAVQESFANCTELKDLQLPPARATANFPPTCGRRSNASPARRCRRTAA